MTWWDALLRRVRELWEAASGGTRAIGGPPGGEAVVPMQRRVLMVSYNPVVASEGGRKLNQVLGWNDPDTLAHQYAADLLDVSGGLADYRIVERIEVNGWPAKIDGFFYTAESFLQCWRARSGWHDPDAVDYAHIVDELDLLARVARQDLDEVWLFGTPFAGFYESIMCGPGSFWCNAPPLGGTEASGRRFVIMGFNYERGVGEMLESFGHRVESHLGHAWRRWSGDQNLWEVFTRYDRPGGAVANCGNVHFAPNSVRDYDWGNPRFVLSVCDDWYNFPNFTGRPRRVNCAEWGNGEIRAHHLWWLRHLPRIEGETRGVSNNWWRYAVDPDAVS